MRTERIRQIGTKNWILDRKRRSISQDLSPQPLTQFNWDPDAIFSLSSDSWQASGASPPFFVFSTLFFSLFVF